MPIYEYACEKCGTKIDVLQKMDDPAPAKCEKCGASGTMSRQVSRTSFVLKGGGWYSDLYGSTKKDSSSSSSSGSSGASSSTPSTPAAASTASSAPSSGSTSSGSGGSSGSSGGSSSSGGPVGRRERRLDRLVGHRRQVGRRGGLTRPGGQLFALGANRAENPLVPFPSKKRARRRCSLCGALELSDQPEGRFLLVADPQGRGPVCPPGRGCTDRQRQLPLLDLSGVVKAAGR